MLRQRWDCDLPVTGHVSLWSVAQLQISISEVKELPCCPPCCPKNILLSFTDASLPHCNSLVIEVWWWNIMGQFLLKILLPVYVQRVVILRLYTLFRPFFADVKPTVGFSHSISWEVIELVRWLLTEVWLYSLWVWRAAVERCNKSGKSWRDEEGENEREGDREEDKDWGKKAKKEAMTHHWNIVWINRAYTVNMK